MNVPAPDRWMDLWRQPAAEGDMLPCHQELVRFHSPIMSLRGIDRMGIKYLGRAETK